MDNTIPRLALQPFSYYQIHSRKGSAQRSILLGLLDDLLPALAFVGLYVVQKVRFQHVDFASTLKCVELSVGDFGIHGCETYT